MEQPIIVHYRNTIDEFIAAQTLNRQWIRKRNMPKNVFVIIILVVTFSYFIFSSWAQMSKTDIDRFLFTLIPVVIFIIGIILTINLLTKKVWKDTFEKYPVKNKEVEYLISSDGIQSKNPLSSFEMLWDNIITVLHGRTGFLLFTHPQITHWIPNHGFENEDAISSFVTIAKSKVKKYYKV